MIYELAAKIIGGCVLWVIAFLLVWLCVYMTTYFIRALLLTRLMNLNNLLFPWCNFWVVRTLTRILFAFRWSIDGRPDVIRTKRGLVFDERSMRDD